jgi:hypothetical protein
MGITVGVPEKESAEVGIGVLVGGNGVAKGNSAAVEVSVGIAVCVSAIVVPAIAMAVSIPCVGCVLSVGRKLLQEVNITTVRSNESIALLVIFISPVPLMFCNETPN